MLFFGHEGFNFFNCSWNTTIGHTPVLGDNHIVLDSNSAYTIVLFDFFEIVILGLFFVFLVFVDELSNEVDSWLVGANHAGLEDALGDGLAVRGIWGLFWVIAWTDIVDVEAHEVTQ